MSDDRNAPEDWGFDNVLPLRASNGTRRDGIRRDELLSLGELPDKEGSGASGRGPDGDGTASTQPSIGGASIFDTQRAPQTVQAVLGAPAATLPEVDSEKRWRELLAAAPSDSEVRRARRRILRAPRRQAVARRASPARYLAPLGVAAAILVCLSLVATMLTGGGSSPTARARRSASAQQSSGLPLAALNSGLLAAARRASAAPRRVPRRAPRTVPRRTARHPQGHGPAAPSTPAPAYRPTTVAYTYHPAYSAPTPPAPAAPQARVAVQPSSKPPAFGSSGALAPGHSPSG